MNGFDARFIELAGAINESMPRFVVERITDALNQHRKSVRGSRIHVLGVAYKAGVNDIRESPALTVMKIPGRQGRDPVVHRSLRPDACARRASSSTRSPPTTGRSGASTARSS